MSTLMQLPVEVRLMIYRYCLIVSKVFPNAIPSNDVRYNGWEKYEKPHAALLRVSKEINTEAREVLFDKGNLYVIPRGAKVWLNQVPAPGLQSRTLRPLLQPRSTSMSFTFRDSGGFLPYAITAAGFTAAVRMSPTSLLDLDERDSLRHAHDSTRRTLIRVWREKMSWLCSLPKVDRLELDMSEFCCPFGCCFGAELFSLFNVMDFDAAKWPRDMIIKGCGNETVDRELELAVRDFQAASTITAEYLEDMDALGGPPAASAVSGL